MGFVKVGCYWFVRTLVVLCRGFVLLLLLPEVLLLYGDLGFVLRCGGW